MSLGGFSRGAGPVSTPPVKLYKKASQFQQCLQRLLIQHFTLPLQTDLSPPEETLFVRLKEHQGNLLYCKLRILVSFRLRFSLKAVKNVWKRSEILARKMRLIVIPRLRLYMQILKDSECIAPRENKAADLGKGKTFFRVLRLLFHSRIRFHFHVLRQTPVLGNGNRESGSFPLAKDHFSALATGQSDKWGRLSGKEVSEEDLKSSLVACEGCYPGLVQRLIYDLSNERSFESETRPKTFGKKAYSEAKTQ